MPLSCLAVVELQLIMQFCKKSSLLQLARCSHFTLSCASAPFAVRHLSPLCFDVNTLRFKQGKLLRQSLLRHCSISVSCWQSVANLPSGNMKPEVRCMHSILFSLSNVTALNERYIGLSPQSWTWLLSGLAQPEGLSALDLTVKLTKEIVETLKQHHSNLRSVKLDHTDQLLLEALPSFRSLRNVRFRMEGKELPSLPPFHLCTSLRELSLESPFEGYLEPMLTAPSMRQLESLSLSFLCALQAHGRGSEPSPIGWEGIFRNLSNLRSLSLRHVWGLDAVLAPVVRHCRQLSELNLLIFLLETPEQIGQLQPAQLAVRARPLRDHLGAQMPSEELLHRLLSTMSRHFRMFVELPHQNIYQHDHYSLDPFWKREELDQQWAHAWKLFGDLDPRVTVDELRGHDDD
jgi:hypothetical protein